MAVSTTTNIALQKIVVDKKIDQDFPNLIAAAAANADLIEKISSGVTAVATNATIINTSGYKNIQLYSCSVVTLTTITGMVTGVPFNLIMMSSGATYHLPDELASKFHLSADWTPQQYDVLTLIWDGSGYIEVGRVNN
jgi:hypothetical protein